MLVNVYPKERLDIAPGTSKVVKTWVSDFNGNLSDLVFSRKNFPFHPNPSKIIISNIDALNEPVRIRNKSDRVVSLFPDSPIMVFVYEEPELKSAVFNFDVTDIKDDYPVEELDISESIIEKLKGAGYDWISDVKESKDTELNAIKGVGPATVSRIRKAVNDFSL